MAIIFARTDYNYQSYTDFWKLVELSGFPIVRVYDMDVFNPENVYIVCPMNGEMYDFMNDDKRLNHKATILQWNLERPGLSSEVHSYEIGNRDLIEKHYFDGIIISDRHLAAITGFKYVTLGSHPGLGEPGQWRDKVYDLIHLSCYSLNRSWMFRTPSEPRDKIEGLTIAPNGWGEERHRHLMRSKAMLTVHQDGLPFLEPLRIALAAAYGLCVISERVLDAYPYPPYLMQHQDVILGAKKWLTINEDAVFPAGLQFRELMCTTLSFRNCLENQL